MTARFDDKLVLCRDRGSDSAKKLIIAAGIGVTLAIAIVLFGKPVVSLLREEDPAALGQAQAPAQPRAAVDEITSPKRDTAPAPSAKTRTVAKSAKLQIRHPDKTESVIFAEKASKDRVAGLPDSARIFSR